MTETVILGHRVVYGSPAAQLLRYAQDYRDVHPTESMSDRIFEANTVAAYVVRATQATGYLGPVGVRPT